MGSYVGLQCRTLLQSNQSDGWSKEREERGDRSLAEQQETRHSCAKISHLFYHIQNPTIRDDLGIILA